jgi:hypothetical protein
MASAKAVVKTVAVNIKRSSMSQLLLQQVTNRDIKIP